MNKYILYNDYAEIILCDKKGKEKARALIDIEDIEKVIEYTWCQQSKGYVIGNNKDNNKILIHRFILNCPKNKVVDHINLNKLDNRKSNLRICTMQENDFNKPILKNNTSNKTGVSFVKRNNCWRAYININKKQIHLGYFKNIEEAIKVRKEAEEKYFREFRYKQ